MRLAFLGTVVLGGASLVAAPATAQHEDNPGSYLWYDVEEEINEVVYDEVMGEPDGTPAWSPLDGVVYSAPRCARSCVHRYTRRCVKVIYETVQPDGTKTKTETESCDQPAYAGTDCGPPMCMAGARPPALPPPPPPPPARPPTPSPAPTQPQVACTQCDMNKHTGIANATKAMEACHLGAQREAARRCQSWGINVPDCRSYVLKGAPFGIEFPIGQGAISLGGGGTPLLQVCLNAFNDATVKAQSEYAQCLSQNGCI